MIAKQFRVPRERINYILRKGQQHFSKLFIIRCAPNQAGFSRFRTIVSTKVHKSAVDRNKLRRQIYESLRLEITKKHSSAPLDTILIPKKAIKSATFEQIISDLNSIPWKNLPAS